MGSGARSFLTMAQGGEHLLFLPPTTPLPTILLESGGHGGLLREGLRKKPCILDKSSNELQKHGSILACGCVLGDHSEKQTWYSESQGARNVMPEVQESTT